MFAGQRDNSVFNGLATLFNLIVRPKAYFKGEVNRILDESYDNIVQFWPAEVRFKNDISRPRATEYVSEFPENPSKMPENLGGFTFNYTASIQFSPVKKKWLTQEFLAAVDDKIANLERAANFPECTLRLNGFQMLKDIAADNNRAANDKTAIDMIVSINIQGKKNTPAPQQ